MSSLHTQRLAVRQKPVRKLLAIITAGTSSDFHRFAFQGQGLRVLRLPVPQRRQRPQQFDVGLHSGALAGKIEQRFHVRAHWLPQRPGGGTLG